VQLETVLSSNNPYGLADRAIATPVPSAQCILRVCLTAILRCPLTALVVRYSVGAVRPALSLLTDPGWPVLEERSALRDVR
jgi:hypothetical protein